MFEMNLQFREMKSVNGTESLMFFLPLESECKVCMRLSRGHMYPAPQEDLALWKSDRIRICFVRLMKGCRLNVHIRVEMQKVLGG